MPKRKVKQSTWRKISESHYTTLKPVNPRAQSPHCFWCGIFMTPTQSHLFEHLPTDRTVDHVVPRSRGGLDTQDNRVPSCLDCNRRRGNALPDPKVMMLLGLVLPD